MDTARFQTNLRAQRERIDQSIAALEALYGNVVVPGKRTIKASKPASTKSAKTAPPASKKRVISPEAPPAYG
jgi:hypothetical protein